MVDFLDELDLEPEEREKLRSLGAPDARALRAMFSAAPDDFSAYVGLRTAHVVAELDRVVGGDVVVQQSPTVFSLGARIDAPSGNLSAPPIDFALRDRLFEELEDWRQRPSSPQRDAAIADLEDQLNALLDANL